MNLLFPITFSFKKRIKTNALDASRKERLMESLSHFLVKRGFKTVRKSGERTQFYDPHPILSGLMHYSGRINNGTLVTRMDEENREIEIKLTCINYYTLGFTVLAGLGLLIFKNQLPALGDVLWIPSILVLGAIGLNTMVRYVAHKRFVKEMEQLALEAVQSN